MFDFDAGKLLIVGVIALIFIPPKDLPRVLRQVGQFVGKMRRMAADFQGQFMEAMRDADMADLRREAQKLADTARVDVKMDSVYDLRPERPATEKLATETPADPPGEDLETDRQALGPTRADDERLADPVPELRRLSGTAAPRDETPAEPSDKAKTSAPQSA